MKLQDLHHAAGAVRETKRRGKGAATGLGGTAGKGHKGQKARSGGSLRLGFEGGQMPLIRRLPKRGFNNAAFKKNYALVNLDDLNEFKAGAVVNEQTLRELKHIRGDVAGLKILGRGELKHGLTIEADRFSASAREKIEKAGGTVTLRERPSLTDGKRSEADAREKAPTPAAPAKAKAKKPAAKKKKTAE